MIDFENLKFGIEPLKALRERIKDNKCDVEKLVLGNRLNSLEEIKYYLGVVKGFEGAISIIDKFIKDNFNAN